MAATRRGRGSGLSRGVTLRPAVKRTEPMQDPHSKPSRSVQRNQDLFESLFTVEISEPIRCVREQRVSSHLYALLDAFEVHLVSCSTGLRRTKLDGEAGRLLVGCGYSTVYNSSVKYTPPHGVERAQFGQFPARFFPVARGPLQLQLTHTDARCTHTLVCTHRDTRKPKAKESVSERESSVWPAPLRCVGHKSG